MSRMRTFGRAAAYGAAAASLVGLSYVARSWFGYGRPHLDGAPDPLLDRFMPACEVAERHEVDVDAPADVTWAAARALDIHRSALIRSIFTGRELLMRAPHEARPSRSLLEETLSIGWGVLAEEPGREIVVGAIARPWHADPGFRPLPPDEFAAFAEPGWAKIVWTLSVEPRGAGRSRFRTETRVATTGPDARRRFRRYWTMLSPGILLIRRASLSLVKGDAERRAAEAVPPVAAAARR